MLQTIIHNDLSYQKIFVVLFVDIVIEYMKRDFLNCKKNIDTIDVC